MTQNQAKMPITLVGCLLLVISSWINFLPLNNIVIINWKLIDLSSMKISWTIVIDTISLSFSLTVLLISLSVSLFSLTYMKNDQYKKRFSIILSLFILSMNVLIFCPNIITLILGWDGLGLTSFLLIIHYQNARSLSAGMLTALTNRFGDVMILISIAMMASMNMYNPMVEQMKVNMPILGTMILMAGATKCAQSPFSAWLPAAMAAPTPVSTLVHSSTLVTAGVFLLIRFYPIVSSSPLAMKSMLLISSMTTILASMNAMKEMDMKKVVALSTLAQLGFMVMAISCSLPQISFFHLITHAMFKSLLFLCVGNIIMISSHYQDTRLLTQPPSSMPINSSCMILATMALSGLPFLSGFFSKDMIMENSIFNKMPTLIIMIMAFAASMTSAYSARLVYSSLWLAPSTPLKSASPEKPLTIVSLMILSTLSSMVACIYLWSSSLPSMGGPLPPLVKMMPTMAMILGVLVFAFSMSLTKVTSLKNLLDYAFSSMWFLPKMSSKPLSPFILHVGSNTLQIVDQGWMEVIGAKGVKEMTSYTSVALQPSQSKMANSIIMFIMMVTPACLLTL